jgi:kynurenine formamidase
LSIGCHIGTHVDAPAHFVRGGLTVDQLPAKHFFGPAIVPGIDVLCPNRRRDADKI